MFHKSLLSLRNLSSSIAKKYYPGHARPYPLLMIEWALDHMLHHYMPDDNYLPPQPRIGQFKKMNNTTEKSI
jgi:hypothetical protein